MSKNLSLKTTYKIAAQISLYKKYIMYIKKQFFKNKTKTYNSSKYGKLAKSLRFSVSSRFRAKILQNR